MKTEIIVFVALLLLAGFYVGSFTGLFVGVPTTHANRIIDGDTIEVAGAEKVRLIGIDTPEKGQYYYDEAKERLRELIGGKEILLETDRTDKDKYDRLLRYIYINRTELVNIMLVKEGLARALIIQPDNKYEEEILKAEAEARNQKLGLWEYEGISDVYCIGIFYFRYNAMGDDRNNLNDEYIEFRNSCTYPVDMTGWTVRDDYGHEYEFPEFAATEKTKFRLRTGSGEDTGSDVYWNSGKAVWNNAGDSMEMRNAEGTLILNYEYKGY
jgi:micrococcal nuclease